MRIIDINQVTKAVKDLCISSNIELPDDVLSVIKKSRNEETSATAQDVLDQIISNADIAVSEQLPLCQDTGIAVVFLEIGQDLHITGGDLYRAIDQGIKEGYEEGYLRKSIVADPLRRQNTGDNTPAVIHSTIVPGNKLKIILAPKGGGSENMSRIAMLKPADGWEGIKQFILETVSIAGANPCPPVIVGIGIGGNFEVSALLAKKSLLRRLDDSNLDPFYAAKEAELLTDINKLGIGPAGFGGNTTALAVKILIKPCHIASLPVAVNIQCHSARHKEVTL